ncbi:MAG: class I SAM-dependent methyltransferase [Acidobacteria bacterium]|nr:class I SAM-dependent methyltransferase [Acidobacteriota bacterium]
MRRDPPPPPAHELAREVAEGWIRLSAAPLDPALAASVGSQLHLLYLWNRRFNLTAIRDPRDGVKRHALEALEGTLVPDLPERGLLVDLGSGNGFPALPLLAARPGLTGLLIESSARKVDFLRAAARESGLTERVRAEQRLLRRIDELPQETALLTLRGFPDPERWILEAIDVRPTATVLAWLALDDAGRIARALQQRGARAEVRPLRSSGIGAILRTGR